MSQMSYMQNGGAQFIILEDHTDSSGEVEAGTQELFYRVLQWFQWEMAVKCSWDISTDFEEEETERLMLQELESTDLDYSEYLASWDLCC